MSREWNGILTIAYRDLIKFLRDRVRLISTFVFPAVFIAILGGSFQAGVGPGSGIDFMSLVFTGVLAQTLFQSAALGIVSLIEDRQTDFSQEIFVAPISRYSIILGKIGGESAVALSQAVGILIFAVLLGIPLSPSTVIALVPTLIATCLLGGAFGVVVMSTLTSQRAAQQVFPFIMLPQYFLAGVFAPIQGLPSYLAALSLVTPLRYAVDLVRGVYYAGAPEHDRVVLADVSVNVVVIVALFTVFLVIGTARFVRAERNR